MLKMLFLFENVNIILGHILKLLAFELKLKMVKNYTKLSLSDKSLFC